MYKYNVINNDQYPTILAELKREGYLIYELDTFGIVDIKTIYGQLIELLPIGIPLSGNVHWDAFLDSAWEGLTEQPNKEITLIWHGSECILNKKLSDFLIVFETLCDLSTQLAKAFPGGYSLVIYLTGSEENYSLT